METSNGGKYYVRHQCEKFIMSQTEFGATHSSMRETVVNRHTMANKTYLFNSATMKQIPIYYHWFQYFFFVSTEANVFRLNGTEWNEFAVSVCNTAKKWKKSSALFVHKESVLNVAVSNPGPHCWLWEFKALII